MEDNRIKTCALDDLILPPLTVDNCDDDGLLKLRDAIVLDACKDFVKYIRAERYHSQRRGIAHRRAAELVKVKKEGVADFFNSSWYKLLTMNAVDGEKVMYTLEHDMPLKWMTAEERKEVLENAKAEGKDISACAGPDLVEG